MDGNKMKLSIMMEQFKPNFTRSELKLYEYICHHYEKVMYHSLTELSEICQVGEATILRFCRKIGLKGYQDFKLAVAQELSLMNQKSQSEETFIEKIKHNMISVIEDTYTALDEPDLMRAIELIDASSDIVIYGVGHSGISALDLKSRFLRIGRNVQVVTDPHFQIMRSCSMDSNTVVIAISLTGSTKDIIDAVAKAKEREAKIVAITNYVRSPLTKHADVVLLTSGKENPLDGGSMVAKVSQLYVIDLLCTGYAIENIEKAQAYKQHTAAAVSEKMY